MTDDISGAWVQVATSGMVDTTVCRARAWAWATWDVHTIARVSVVANLTPVTVGSRRKVPALDAVTCPRITCVRVTVAVTTLAVGVVPEARLAFVALSAVRVGSAFALASLGIAEVVQGTNAVAVTWSAASRSKTIGSRCTAVAAAAYHIGLALALTTQRVAHTAVRALWVAPAILGSLEDVEADAVEVLLADFGKGAPSSNGVECLATSEAFEFLPPVFVRWCSVEERDGIYVRHEHHRVD